MRARGSLQKAGGGGESAVSDSLVDETFHKSGKAGTKTTVLMSGRMQNRLSGGWITHHAEYIVCKSGVGNVQRARE